MRALRFHQFGAPDVLSIEDIPDPVPAAHEALVQIKAASVNPSDVKNVAGRMEQTTLPRTPGRDFSGTVILGPAEWLGVDVFGTGDMGFTRDGTHAERITVPVAALCRKPANLSHEAAAAIGVNFVTAWCALTGVGKLQPGETLAIIGLGGVGTAAAQIARLQGARVLGVVRRAPPLESPALGSVDELIAGEADTAGRVRALGAADFVFDTVGGPMLTNALAMLKLGGRVAEISPGRSPQVTFNLADFYHNESVLIGVDSLKRDVTACAAILAQLAPGFADGSYRPALIERTYPLDQGRQAYEEVEKASGKLVLVP